MRSLIDLLFSNLIPIIIAVSVVIRIVMGIKKAGDRKRETPEPQVYKRDDEEETADVWSRLRPDDDDEEDEQYQAPIDPAAFSRPLLTQSYELAAPLEAPPEALAASPAPEEIPPGVGHSPTAAFFLRIGRLSPLRQAVIMAEVLGSPKGMD
jgi:hypothetical protein